MLRFIIFSVLIHLVFGGLIIFMANKDIASSWIKNLSQKNNPTNPQEIEKPNTPQKQPLADNLSKKDLAVKESKIQKPDQKIKPKEDLKSTPSKPDMPEPVIVKNNDSIQEKSIDNKLTTPSQAAIAKVPVDKDMKENVQDNSLSIPTKAPIGDLQDIPSKPDTPEPSLAKEAKEKSLEQVLDEHPELANEDMLEEIKLPPNDEDIPLIPREEELAKQFNKKTISILDEKPSSHNTNNAPSKEIPYATLLQASHNPQMTYPLIAQKQKLEGSVEVMYFVNDSGFVNQTKVLKSSGHSILDDEALRTLSRYQYLPGQEGWYRHKIEFKLQNPQEVRNQASTLNPTDPS